MSDSKGVRFGISNAHYAVYTEGVGGALGTYATPVARSRVQEPLAMAVVIEDGESGGGTAAPIVASVLRSFYNRREEAVQ